ncbi:hypothetical protein J6590_020381 [Homalodisca vitripennis]|nr:hypothetical protein J6590_020381 [Homalodisca vitripennis]
MMWQMMIITRCAFIIQYTTPLSSHYKQPNSSVPWKFQTVPLKKLPGRNLRLHGLGECIISPKVLPTLRTKISLSNAINEDEARHNVIMVVISAARGHRLASTAH